MRTRSGKNLLPSILPSLPPTLLSLNIQSTLPATLPHTIAPNIHTYLLSRSTLSASSPHRREEVVIGHGRVSSIDKDDDDDTSTAIVTEVNEDSENEDGDISMTSPQARVEDLLRLPKETKILIAKGELEHWTAACEDDIGALRTLLDDGGVKELVVDGPSAGAAGTVAEQGMVVVRGGEDGGWGTIGRGCVEWGIRVGW